VAIDSLTLSSVRKWDRVDKVRSATPSPELMPDPNQGRGIITLSREPESNLKLHRCFKSSPSFSDICRCHSSLISTLFPRLHDIHAYSSPDTRLRLVDNGMYIAHNQSINGWIASVQASRRRHRVGRTPVAVAIKQVNVVASPSPS
jgi:hypothetical protein